MLVTWRAVVRDIDIAQCFSPVRSSRGNRMSYGPWILKYDWVCRSDLLRRHWLGLWLAADMENMLKQASPPSPEQLGRYFILISFQWGATTTTSDRPDVLPAKNVIRNIDYCFYFWVWGAGVCSEWRFRTGVVSVSRRQDEVYLPFVSVCLMNERGEWNVLFRGCLNMFLLWCVPESKVSHNIAACLSLDSELPVLSVESFLRRS